jgi:hypothetical protein
MLAGCAFLLAGLLAFRMASQSAKLDSLVLAGVFGLLTFFAMVVDVFHSVMITILPASDFFVAMIEDGGEMLTLWLSVAASLAMASNLLDARRGRQAAMRE